jgi:Ca2+-transporting ATPase
VSDWYTMASERVVRELDTDAERGLSGQEASRRLETYGPNELMERGGTSPWRILLEQFTSTMVMILLLAAGVSVFLGDYKDTAAILIIVVLNALLGFNQEYRAEKAMAALRRLAVPHVKVRRGGQVRQIDARELVPGDLMLLEAGDLVPADGRLLHSANLRLQEAALTGESATVEKDPQAHIDAAASLGDRCTMVYMGTSVTYGRGQAVVTETGMQTELGRIAEMLQSVEREQTPLQRRLAQLGRSLALAALVLVALVGGVGLLRGEEFEVVILTALSLAVAAVPEGLPAVVTIALALGAQRMLKREALIRKLPAVETLGSVTVICADKTGTLTENRMTVTTLEVASHRVDLPHPDADAESSDDAETPRAERLEDDPALALLLLGGALCNDAELQSDDEQAARIEVLGDPTESAMVEAAARFALRKPALESVLPREAEVPFESDRKRMTTVHKLRQPDELPAGLATILGRNAKAEYPAYFAFTKGAVDSLLQVCNAIWTPEGATKLDQSWRQRISDANEELARQGRRVLGVAYRPLEILPEGDAMDRLEQDLIFIGLVGMIDPPRQAAIQAVKTCRLAGIRPIMITGDHPSTAQAIARQLGLAAQNERTLTGQEVAQSQGNKLEELVDEVSVYARVSPEHKLRIVEALQNRGHIAAMTGDGVNDAPALRKADIGVAMGQTGTEVSKEASDMVLLNDNFATIVAAVEEGRVIYDNVRKFIKYTLTSNAGEIWVMLLAPLLGMPLPLVPLQILWINLMTDGLPGLAMTVEPAERNTMRRPPHHPGEHVLGRRMGWDILWVGLLMGLIPLGLGYWYWQADHRAWQTMVFTTLTLLQMGNALATRSQSDSFWRIGPLSNPAMLGAVALTFVSQLAVVYVPFLQGIFRTVPLSGADLTLALLLSTAVFWSVELQKWLMRRNNDYENHTGH